MDLDLWKRRGEKKNHTHSKYALSAYPAAKVIETSLQNETFLSHSWPLLHQLHPLFPFLPCGIHPPFPHWSNGRIFHFTAVLVEISRNLLLSQSSQIHRVPYNVSWLLGTVSLKLIPELSSQTFISNCVLCRSELWSYFSQRQKLPSLPTPLALKVKFLKYIFVEMHTKQ